MHLPGLTLHSGWESCFVHINLVRTSGDVTKVLQSNMYLLGLHHGRKSTTCTGNWQPVRNASHGSKGVPQAGGVTAAGGGKTGKPSRCPEWRHRLRAAEPHDGGQARCVSRQPQARPRGPA